jgi:hypothetical protein
VRKTRDPRSRVAGAPRSLGPPRYKPAPPPSAPGSGTAARVALHHHPPPRSSLVHPAIPLSGPRHRRGSSFSWEPRDPRSRVAGAPRSLGPPRYKSASPPSAPGSGAAARVALHHHRPPPRSRGGAPPHRRRPGCTPSLRPSATSPSLQPASCTPTHPPARSRPPRQPFLERRLAAAGRRDFKQARANEPFRTRLSYLSCGEGWRDAARGSRCRPTADAPEK